MSRIYVDVAGIRRENYKLPSLETSVAQARRRTKGVKCQIKKEISTKYQIGERLDHIYRELAQLESQIHDLYTLTNICAEQYEQSERENSRNAARFD